MLKAKCHTCKKAQHILLEEILDVDLIRGECIECGEEMELGFEGNTVVRWVSDKPEPLNPQRQDVH